MKPLKPKHQKFCDEYLINPEGTGAAVRAGYSANNANKVAFELLQRDDVKQYLEEKRKRLSVKTEITRARVLREYAKIAFSDMTDFQKWEDGVITLKNSSELKRKKSGAISELSETISERGVRTLKIKLHNKLNALDSLSKLQGYIIERREISGPNGKPIEVKTEEKEIDLSHLTDQEMIEYKRLTEKVLASNKKKTINVTCDYSNT